MRRGNCSVSGLIWATPKENQARRIGHGTSNRGTRHGMARLNKIKVGAIVRRIERGDSKSSIARAFDVSPTTIRDIDAGNTWGWLTGRAA